MLRRIIFIVCIAVLIALQYYFVLCFIEFGISSFGRSLNIFVLCMPGFASLQSYPTYLSIRSVCPKGKGQGPLVRDASSMGCIVHGTSHLRDVPSKGRLIHGTHCLIKGRNIRDIWFGGHIGRGRE
jgi:hypothetical protein